VESARDSCVLQAYTCRSLVSTPPDLVSQGLLTSASKHEGTYRYNFATVPFLAELLKLIISSILLQRQKQTNPGTSTYRAVQLGPLL